MKFVTAKLFKWDIQQCVPRFYQATGTCEAAPFDPSACHKNGDCPTQTMVTVMACDVPEACRKIKAKLRNFKLQKLVQFTKPALGQSREDPTCNTDVTPGPANCADCCDLLPSAQSSSSSSAEPVSLSPYIRNISLLGSEPLLAWPDEAYDAEDTYGAEYLVGLSEVANYAYTGSGTLQTFGSAPLDADDLGVFTLQAPLTASLSDDQLLAAFVPERHLPLPERVQVVRIACCPGLFTLGLELRHTLTALAPFAAFLRTNGRTVPGVIAPGKTGGFIKLTYAVRADEWQGGLNFTGQSPAGSGQESWGIDMQFGCDDAGQWKFALTATLGRSGRRQMSRLLVYFKRETVCPGIQFFGLDFAVDVATQTVTPAAPLVINDEGGIFRNSRLAFRIRPQAIGSGSHQRPADNTEAYDATLSGGT